MNTKASAFLIGFPCSVVLFVLLMISLWEYRVWVGFSLLILLFVVVGVYMRGQLTEQHLRIYRFNHNEETPLDGYGQPVVLRPDMRESARRQDSTEQYGLYQGSQRWEG